MKQIRQLIQKGDPVVRTQLPTVTLRMLEAAAKKNKRRMQDQFIKGLADSFKKDEASLLAPLFEKFLPELKASYQVQ